MGYAEDFARRTRQTLGHWRKVFSPAKAPIYYDGRLEGTVKHHRCHVLLHASEPPSGFPRVFQTPVSRELLRRGLKWGGIVNFSYVEGEKHLPDTQPATVFSHLGGKLNIPDVSMENMDAVETSIKSHLDGPITDATSESVHIYVCTHGERDCRCGERGQQVCDALIRAVRAERDRAPSGPANKITIGEVAHVGGHKFAANVLLFPQGEWLGIVKPEDAPSIIIQVCEDLTRSVMPLSLLAKPVSLRHWRGRMGMTQQEQQALYAEFAAKSVSE